VNRKRTFTLPECYLEEEDRQRQLFKIFAKLKDLEEDKSVTTNPQNSTTSFNKTVSSSTAPGGFFSSNP
jgi:hypothetical protein